MIRPPEQITHPSPHRGKVSAAWLLAGLAIPPTAWVLGMLVGFIISSNACPSVASAAPQVGLAGDAALLIVVELVCLAATIASGLMSRRQWRRVRLEKQDSEHAHLTLGEGRTRFIALTGMLTSGVFAVAILFNLLEPILIPICRSV